MSRPENRSTVALSSSAFTGLIEAARQQKV
jgi:hypothetical protein